MAVVPPVIMTCGSTTCCNLKTLLTLMLIASCMQTAHLILQQNLYLECSCLHANAATTPHAGSNNWRSVSLNSTMARNAKNDCYMIFISGSAEELVAFRFKELLLRPGCLDYIEIFPYLREPVIENSTNPEYVVCHRGAAANRTETAAANGQRNTNNHKSQATSKSNVTTTNEIVVIDDDKPGNIGHDKHNNQKNNNKDEDATDLTKAIDVRELLTGPDIYSGGKVLGLRVRFKKPDSPLVEWPLSIKGEYRYLKREHFRNDGRLIAGSYCDYYFFAEASGTGPLNVWQYFHSPRFPANYPAHIKCAYKFIGRPDTRVEIVFEELHLPKPGESCQMDKLTIFDAESANMNAVIDVLCGSTPPTRRLISSGPDLLIEFNASSNVTGKGFRGKFKFQPNAAHSTVGATTTRPVATPPPIQVQHPNGTTGSSAALALQRIAAAAAQKDTIPWQYENVAKLAKGNDECRKKFASRSSKEGRFEASHLFQNNIASSFPVRVLCRFEFHGTDDERVQIKFLDFNIPTESKNSTTCRNSDSLQLLKMQQNRAKYEVADMFCGAFLPKPLMSAGNTMFLQFAGKLFANHPKVGFYGFKAEYRFVKNFGIFTGHQIENNCSFAYNSTDKKSGWFGSPNFPGLYPHNLICNYYFYGLSDEYVKIRFTYFDVEGIGTCEQTTASDYVEFSNFMSTDRKFTKYCGKHDKFEMRSDGRFFRITFFSNDRFDKTGFRALYDFENTNVRVENSTSMQSYVSSGHCIGKQFVFVYFLLLGYMFSC